MAKTDGEMRRPRRRIAPLPLNPWKLLLRLTISCLVVAPLFILLEPAIGRVLAWITRDLMVLASSAPYIAEISWAHSKFSINSPFFPVYLNVRLHVLPFMFAFPIAFALALPWIHWIFYLRRVALALFVSFLSCAALLAIFSEAHLAVKLLHYGIIVHEPWRRILVHSVANGFWEIGAIAYPLIACALFAQIAITDLGRKKPRAFRSEPSTRRTLLRVSCSLALLAFVSCEFVAQKRLSAIRATPRRDLFSALEAKNPKLGRSLMQLGDFFFKKQEYRPARKMYIVATRYPESAERAREQLKQVKKHIESRPKRR